MSGETAVVPVITTEAAQSPAIASDTSVHFANTEEVTGVVTDMRDSHKSKYVKGPLNLLIGDLGAKLPVGCPLRREPANETITTETA